MVCRAALLTQLRIRQMLDKQDIDAKVQPRHPEVTVQLSGQDGNAFTIMGRVAAAMRRAGVSPVEIDAYYAEAMAGDYDNLLQVTMRWVDWE